MNRVALLAALALSTCMPPAAYASDDEPWFLLTIVGNAVNPSHGFKSRHMCEEGISLFKYGQTIEDKKATDIKAAADQKAREEEFAKKYKPRPPKDADERKMVAQAKKDGYAARVYAMYCGFGTIEWYADTDGLMYPEDADQRVCGTVIDSIPRDAYCVPDNQPIP